MDKNPLFAGHFSVTKKTLYFVKSSRINPPLLNVPASGWAMEDRRFDEVKSFVVIVKFLQTTLTKKWQVSII